MRPKRYILLVFFSLAGFLPKEVVGATLTLRDDMVIVGELASPLRFRTGSGHLVISPDNLIHFEAGEVELLDGQRVPATLDRGRISVHTRYGALQVPAVLIVTIRNVIRPATRSPKEIEEARRGAEAEGLRRGPEAERLRVEKEQAERAAAEAQREKIIAGLTQALRQKGLREVTITIDGNRSVTLAGRVEEFADRDLAISIAQNYVGVSSVVSQIRVRREEIEKAIQRGTFE